LSRTLLEILAFVIAAGTDPSNIGALIASFRQIDGTSTVQDGEEVKEEEEDTQRGRKVRRLLSCIDGCMCRMEGK